MFKNRFMYFTVTAICLIGLHPKESQAEPACVTVKVHVGKEVDWDVGVRYDECKLGDVGHLIQTGSQAIFRGDTIDIKAKNPSKIEFFEGRVGLGRPLSAPIDVRGGLLIECHGKRGSGVCK